MLPQTSPKWVKFLKDTTDSNPKCPPGAPSPLSYNGLPTPPCQPSHPRAGLGFKWQTGLPSRQDPSLPNKGQNLEEGGQEVEDNMFLGIHPVTTLKLTQSPIQNLAFRSGWMTKDFHTATKLLTGHMWLSNTHMHCSKCRKENICTVPDLTGLNIV